MHHPDTIARYPDSLAELAEEIGNLKYDALADFLRLLAAKVERDSAADAGRGRTRLSAALRLASGHISEAEAEIAEAWRISKRHMPE